jgi:hypothetical protein
MSGFASARFGFGPPRKKARKKKQTNANWFETCSIAELKQLCKAACLPVSGTKAVLVERLIQSDVANSYAYTYSPERGSMFVNYDSDTPEREKKQPKGAGRPNGLSNDCVKQRCREKGLLVSGKRFDLVLRLLQAVTSHKTGVEPKKAAGSFNEETGKFEPKKRAKSTKLPNPAMLDERARKKACPTEAMQDKWSNWKFKQHCLSCVNLASEIIEKEIFEKNLFNRGEEKLACTY